MVKVDEDEARRKLMDTLFHNAPPTPITYTFLRGQIPNNVQMENSAGEFRGYHTLEEGLTKKQINWLRKRRDKMLDKWYDLNSPSKRNSVLQTTRKDLEILFKNRADPNVQSQIRLEKLKQANIRKEELENEKREDLIEKNKCKKI